MKLSLKPHHLKRYKDIALLFWKYGNTDLAKEFEQEAAGGEKTLLAAKPGQPAPEELADDLEKMGRPSSNSASCFPAAPTFCRNDI